MGKGIKLSIIAIFIGIGIWACSDGQTGNENKQDKVSATNEKGKSIFKTYCILCHGADGKLGLNGAKDMSISELSLEERIEVITNGRNTMVPYKGVLEADEIKAVAEYTMRFKSAK